MREYVFEAALCAHLERATEWVVARQLGAAVAEPGARVMDVVGVVPSRPAFDRRAAWTDATVPRAVLEGAVGPGRAVPVADAFDCHPERVPEVLEAGLEAGVLETERERGRGRRLVRTTARYPEGWFARLVGVENKPELSAPGDLDRQLRLDVALGLFDEVWLATASYVTRAHLNRLPDAVGVWRFDPDADERETVREATPLDADGPGVEPLAERPGRTDVATVPAGAKARARRRVAERAYGKGWRPGSLPDCARAGTTADGRPYCGAFDRVVDPGRECGPDCPAHEPGDPPASDPRRLRDARTPWVRDPAGFASRQSGLDRFG